jgi:hypothetical protein
MDPIGWCDCFCCRANASGLIGLRTTAPISGNQSELSSMGPSSVTTSGRQVTVRKGNQDGTFAAPIQPPLGSAAASIVGCVPCLKSSTRNDPLAR